MISLPTRLLLMVPILACEVVIGVGQGQTPLQPRPQPGPRIRSAEPARVTALEVFRIIVEIPKGYAPGIRVAVRRLTHQAATKYLSETIFNNQRPGDISNEDDVIEHGIETDERWLPVAAVGRGLDAASEQYVACLDSSFEGCTTVTVTGGADRAATASVIDGNLETLEKAVREWTRMAGFPVVIDLKSATIAQATPSTPNKPPNVLVWGLNSDRPVAPSVTMHHYVLSETPDQWTGSDLSRFQKSSLMMSATELEKALTYLPKEKRWRSSG